MSHRPCTARPITECGDCTLRERLICRYEPRDTVHFVLLFLPLLVTGIAGLIQIGYGRWLWGWLTYALLFFLIWEARVLCSHCPYWAEPGRILHCHANYGVPKLWPYRPEPMSRSEQLQFLIGALLLAIYPPVLLLIGRAYVLALIGLASATTFGYGLWRDICIHCVNFSCPLNHVDAATREAFLARNPELAESWRQAGRR